MAIDRAFATGMLRRLGAEFIFERPPKGVYDPLEGRAVIPPGRQAESFRVRGVLLSSGPGDALWLAGATIESGDRFLLCDCAKYQPRLEDALLLPEGEYRVKAFSTIEPKGVALARRIHLRRV